MKKLKIDANEPPVSAEVVKATREEVERLARSVSSACIASLILVAVGYFGMDHKPGNLWFALMFGFGLLGFMGLHLFEKGPLARDRRELSPVPDEKLAEAALLCDASPAGRTFRDALRKQKREMILAEFDALQRLAASTPPAVARQALYG